MILPPPEVRYGERGRIVIRGVTRLTTACFENKKSAGIEITAPRPPHAPLARKSVEKAEEIPLRIALAPKARAAVAIHLRRTSVVLTDVISVEDRVVRVRQNENPISHHENIEPDQDRDPHCTPAPLRDPVPLRVAALARAASHALDRGPVLREGAFEHQKDNIVHLALPLHVSETDTEGGTPIAIIPFHATPDPRMTLRAGTVVAIPPPNVGIGAALPGTMMTVTDMVVMIGGNVTAVIAFGPGLGPDLCLRTPRDGAERGLEGIEGVVIDRLSHLHAVCLRRL